MERQLEGAAPEVRAANRLTFMDQCLALLQAAGPVGVTTSDLCQVHHRFATSIHQLRAWGWSIKTKRMKGTDSARYTLNPDIAPVPQPDLLRRVPPAIPSAPPAVGLCDCGHVAGMHRQNLAKSKLYLCTGCDCMDFKQQ